jgi:hypothetical protein
MKDNGKEVSITFRTKKEMKDALQKMADNENRSLSNMIQLLLEQALKNASKKKQ